MQLLNMTKENDTNEGYHIVMKDGISVIQINAKSFYVNSDYFYCFTNETIDNLKRKQKAGIAIDTVFTIDVRFVYFVEKIGTMNSSALDLKKRKLKTKKRR